MISTGRQQTVLFALVALALLAFLMQTPRAAEEKDKPAAGATERPAAKIKELLKERSKVLNKVVDLLEKQYQAGTVSINEVLQAKRAALEAKLDLSGTAAERIAVLKDAVKIAQQMVELTEARVKAGQGSEVDLLRAHALLLQCQVRLLREEGKGKPEK